jgi:hypothetical protein
MDSRAKELCRIGGSLFTKKRSWDELAQEVAENFFPLRADFTSPFALGEDFSEGLMESYPVLAREQLANAVGAMLRQGDWFEVKTGFEEIDEDPANARWLEYATSRLKRLIYDRRANFVRATNEADHDYVAFGNPVLSVEESPTRDHFLFRSWHPRDCAWMENGVGKVDHLQRKMPMTARNMKRRWPKTIHSDVLRACETDPSKEFNVRHVVCSTEDIYADDRKMRRRYTGMPFLSMYVDVEHEVILSEGGLPVFNYVVPRWRTISGFPQGFSPAAITALPDGRMLQSLARIILEQGEKAVDAPMFARGEIFRDAVNRYAGGMTYVDLEADQNIRDAIYTEDVSRGLGFGLDMKQDVRNLIAEAFLLSKLHFPVQDGMPILQVQAILEEAKRNLLPFFGPIESEYHLPLLDTAFSIAINNRQFDFAVAPDGLKRFLQNDDGSPGGELTFTFESPLSSAEGRAHVAAFQESVQLLAGSAQFDQSVPTLVDWKKMTKDAVKGTGAPADWFADEAVQQSAEEQQAQVQRLAAAAEALKAGAGVATDVAGASIALQQAGIA